MSYRQFLANIFLYIPIILWAQNFSYTSDDWYILANPGSIIAITEDSFYTYFATENGIYHYDKIEENFEYNYDLSKDLISKRIYHFYYDENTDYFWIIHSDGISYKSSISSIWREVSLASYGIYGNSMNTNIGSSFSYIWINYDDQFYPFDNLSGIAVTIKESKEEVDYIKWGNSVYGRSSENLELYPYFIGNSKIKNSNKLRKNINETFKVTVFMEDDHGNIWFGTNEGILLKGWGRSYKLEKQNLGLPFNNVTLAYNKNGRWWFSDSRFKRKGQKIDSSIRRYEKKVPFICQWFEAENSWQYYYEDESEYIKHSDVNSIIQVGSIVYFGTMYGVLYLDEFTREWGLIDGSQLYDNAVWDIVSYKNSLFVATSNGINEISIINNMVIPDNKGVFKVFRNTNVFDLELNVNYLYIASDLGLFQIDWEDKNISVLSNKLIRRIHLNKFDLTASDGSLWQYKDNQEYFLASKIQNYDICGSFIWNTNYQNYVTLIDTITSKSWIYNQEDGIHGNKIFDVNCDSDWVWFLTNKGISFFNWSKYHKIY